jgi:hypothetical protein
VLVHNDATAPADVDALIARLKEAFVSQLTAGDTGIAGEPWIGVARARPDTVDPVSLLLAAEQQAQP